MEYQLLICIVKNDDAVEDILTGFLELGIGGATVLTARGMAEIISAQVPLFAGFKDVFQAGGTSRLILSAMPTDKVEEAQRLIERLVEPDGQMSEGVSFSLPIASDIGLHRQASDED